MKYLNQLICVVILSFFSPFLFSKEELELIAEKAEKLYSTAIALSGEELDEFLSCHGIRLSKRHGSSPEALREGIHGALICQNYNVDELMSEENPDEKAIQLMNKFGTSDKDIALAAAKHDKRKLFREYRANSIRTLGHWLNDLIYLENFDLAIEELQDEPSLSGVRKMIQGAFYAGDGIAFLKLYYSDLSKIKNTLSTWGNGFVSQSSLKEIVLSLRQPEEVALAYQFWAGVSKDPSLLQDSRFIPVDGKYRWILKAMSNFGFPYRLAIIWKKLNQENWFVWMTALKNVFPSSDLFLHFLHCSFLENESLSKSEYEALQVAMRKTIEIAKLKTHQMNRIPGFQSTFFSEPASKNKAILDAANKTQLVSALCQERVASLAQDSLLPAAMKELMLKDPSYRTIQAVIEFVKNCIKFERRRLYYFGSRSSDIADALELILRRFNEDSVRYHDKDSSDPKDIKSFLEEKRDYKKSGRVPIGRHFSPFPQESLADVLKTTIYWNALRSYFPDL